MKSTTPTPAAVWTKDGFIKLQAVKVVRWMSEETICFTATVIFNDQPVGTATNEGRGGCTHIHFKTPELREKVEAFAATIDPAAIGYGFQSKVTAADICDHLIEEKDKADHLAKTIASIRRKAAKQVWTLRGDEAKGEYRTAQKALKSGWTLEQVHAELKAKGRRLVSELTDAEIAAHFIA